VRQPGGGRQLTGAGTPDVLAPVSSARPFPPGLARMGRIGHCIHGVRDGFDSFSGWRGAAGGPGATARWTEEKQWMPSHVISRLVADGTTAIAIGGQRIDTAAADRAYARLPCVCACAPVARRRHPQRRSTAVFFRHGGGRRNCQQLWNAPASRDDLAAKPASLGTRPAASLRAGSSAWPASTRTPPSASPARLGERQGLYSSHWNECALDIAAQRAPQSPSRHGSARAHLACHQRVAHGKVPGLAAKCAAAP